VLTCFRGKLFLLEGGARVAEPFFIPRKSPVLAQENNALADTPGAVRAPKKGDYDLRGPPGGAWRILQPAVGYIQSFIVARFRQLAGVASRDYGVGAPVFAGDERWGGPNSYPASRRGTLAKGWRSLGLRHSRLSFFRRFGPQPHSAVIPLWDFWRRIWGSSKWLSKRGLVHLSISPREPRSSSGGFCNSPHGRIDSVRQRNQLLP